MTGPAARDEVLARIRTALGGTASGGTASGNIAPASAAPAADAVPRGYRTQGEPDVTVLLDLLAERLRDYGCTVRLTTPGQLMTEIGEALGQRGARRIVMPSGLGLTGLPAGTESVADDGLSPAALDAVDGVITGAAVAIAETGTIVLDGSPDQGRRALSLVPDYHLCLVRADQVVALVPEALARLDPRPPAHLDQRPVRHQRHRAGPGPGSARPPHPRGDPRGLRAPPVTGSGLSSAACGAELVDSHQQFGSTPTAIRQARGNALSSAGVRPRRRPGL